MITHLAFLAISPGQHKSANIPAFLIGVVAVIVIAALLAVFKRRR